MLGLAGIVNNAQKPSSSTSAASHHVQQPAPVVPPTVAAGPSSFVSTPQLQNHNLLSSLPVGQDETFEKLRVFLNDDNNGIIGIYGMGGVGKTTLMTRVRNDLLVNFEVIIWIVVSKEVDERKIQRDILAKLGLHASQDETQDRQDIYNKLCMMKFVLLIDDIWEYLDMEYHGIPTPTQVKKSKIIFTTRSKEVSAEMHPHKEVEVVGLGWENAWKLFEHHVGDKALKSNPRITELAEQVAKECGGLPLALKVMGRAMASKHTPQQWENALSTLRMSPSEISGTEAKLFSSLEFSYNALPNPTIKECFLYCSLFPEDFSIDKKELVEYWVGEGFLGSDENLIVARNRGLDYINTLMASFLLEEVNEVEVKMHDVILDMGIWIATDHGKKKPNFFVHPQMTSQLTKSQTADRWKEVHRVFVSNSKELPQMTSQCHCHISTILFGDSPECIESLDGLFNSTPLLRVLDLHKFNHDTLPAAMEKMVELRYLRIGTLNGGSELTSLPSWLGNLTKLETLILLRTQIIVLPNTIGQLVELRHLNLKDCGYLEALPVELGNCCKLEMLNLCSTNLEMLPTTVGKLSDLRYLNLSFTCIKTLPEEFWELNNLEDLYFSGDHTMRFTAIELFKLETMRNLNHVEIRVNGLPNPSRLYNCLARLWVDYRPSREDELSMDLLQVFGNADRLSELHILESPVEKIKASNINTKSTTFSSLEILEIRDCANLTEIVVDELSLGNLRYLIIEGCDRLKHIFGLHHLPRLERLSLLECEKLEEVITKATFSSLEILEIRDCANLTEIVVDELCLGNLRYLEIGGCHRLKHIFGLHHLPRLQSLSIRSCKTLEEVIISENSSGGGNICFPTLRILWIEGLDGLKSICSDNVSFPSLETFQLYRCPRLEKLPLGLMNGLRFLTITGCEKLEEVIISENSSGGGGNICFPTLRILSICSLHGLKSICSDSVSFPSLKHFMLDDCPRLEKLPLGLMNGGNSTLQRGWKIWVSYIDGSEEWWNGLKWQDDNFKSFLQPFYRKRG